MPARDLSDSSSYALIQCNESREKERTGQGQFYTKEFRSRKGLVINFYLPLNFFQLSPKKQ